MNKRQARKHIRLDADAQAAYFGCDRLSQRKTAKLVRRATNRREIERHRQAVVLIQKRCKHDNMEDIGYAGPDSGCIHMICNDCGRSWRSVLY